MKNNLWNIFRKEVRELFRDRKSLAMMLIIPVFIPLIIIGMSALFESQTNKDITEYNRIGFAYEMSDAEKAIAGQMDIHAVTGTEKEMRKQFDSGDIYSYVIKEGNSYIINSSSSETSRYSSELVQAYYDTYKEYLQQDFLNENNIGAEQVLNIITVEEKLTQEDSFFAGYIKNYAFLFIIMAITVSATYPATDTTAGERERGTLETLLTFPIRSRDIIVGKFLGVTISAIVTGVVSLLLAIISLMVVQNLFSIYEGVDIMYSPVSIVFAVVVIVAFSFFISGLCIAIAGKSRTFKEAQSALTPLTFVSLFPGMIAFMIGVTGTPLISIIPFLNYVVLFTDINNGDISVLNILLMFVSTIVYISVVLVYIIKQYKSEKVLLAR